MEFKNKNQMKAFLKKEAENLNLSISSTYTTFFALELLRYLSSVQNKRVIVRGSISNLAYSGKLQRAITDIDLTSINYNNEHMLRFLETMFYETQRGINFSLSTQPKKTPTGIYEYQIKCEFDKLKEYVGIDFQEKGRKIFELQTHIIPSVFNGFSEYPIVVPSKEEYLADKLWIISKSNRLDILNTRLKDYYDFYNTYNTEFDFEKFSYYFQYFVNEQGISANELDVGFLDNSYISRHRQMWNHIKNKCEYINDNLSFEEYLYFVKDKAEKQKTRMIKGKNKVY